MLEEIRNPRASLWISASAGTGKTKCLIDRILALLFSGVHPKKILCLTYTKSAATEMLERLAEYIDVLHRLPDSERKNSLNQLGFEGIYSDIIDRLYEQSLSSQNWVQIKTIHGFCFGILQKFPLETGLLGGFRQCEDRQMQKILHESIRAVIADPESHNHLDYISKYLLDFTDIIRDNLMELFIFVSSGSNLKEIYCNYFNIDIDLNDPNVYEKIRNQSLGNNYRLKLKEFAKIYAFGGKDDSKKADILYQSILENSDDFTKVFLTTEGTIRKKLCSGALSEKYPDFAQKLQDMSYEIVEFCEQKNRVISAQANITFFSVVRKILIDEFTERKRKAHVIDFNDSILIAKQLLTDIAWVMYKIDARIDHVLVDEAQDTSTEQWEIIKLLTDEFFDRSDSGRTIFVVGDEKQSIYSFQGANARLFNEMHQYFRERATAGGQKFFDIELSESYRTTGNILAFIDEVFCDSFPEVHHSTHRNISSGVVEVVNLFKQKKTEDSEEQLSEKNIEENQSIADYIAETIDNIIKNRIFVESKMRTAQPSDFLILFRHRDLKTIEKIRSNLKENSIEVAGVDRVLLGEELLVEDLMAFARFALLPYDDLTCAVVLKSPIVGFSENELMKSCLERGEKSLWDHVLSDSESVAKYSLDKLRKYTEIAPTSSALEFFSEILNDGAKENFINRLGEKCPEILSEFLDVVSIYENEYDYSLQNFIDWFSESEHEIKRENFSQKNCVRIMTVHASKGLQAPFVILADSQFSQNKTKSILKSKEGVLFWNFSADARPKKIRELCEHYANSEQQESQRLLYVAMTRAEDFLYILGEQGLKALSKNCWYNIIANALAKNRNKFTETTQNGMTLMRFGNYSHTEESNSTPAAIGENKFFEPPAWYFEKFENKSAGESNSESEHQGDPKRIFHFLNWKMENYRSARRDDFFKIAREFLEEFQIDEKEKNGMIERCFTIFNYRKRANS